TAKLARAGTQIGHAVYAEVKRVPRAASASRFGVAMNGWPAVPRNLGLCSSDIKTRRLAGVMAAGDIGIIVRPDAPPPGGTMKILRQCWLLLLALVPFVPGA